MTNEQNDGVAGVLLFCLVENKMIFQAINDKNYIIFCFSMSMKNCNFFYVNFLFRLTKFVKKNLFFWLKVEKKKDN